MARKIIQGYKAFLRFHLLHFRYLRLIYCTQYHALFSSIQKD